MRRHLRLALALALSAGALVGCDSATGVLENSTEIGEPEGGKGTITIANHRNEAIINVYISSCTSDSWGVDRLEDGARIEKGRSRSWHAPAGCYDVRVDLSGIGPVTRSASVGVGQTTTVNIN